MNGPQLPAVPDAITTALDARDIPRATALACEALEKGVEHPLLLNLRAYWHEANGREAEAFADLRRASELAPDDVSILNALGLSHARAGRLAEALGAFDAALRLQPDFGPAHFNRGWVSEDLGELDAARNAFARAAALKPEAAEPWARIAALAARAGEWAAAKENAERALRLASGASCARRSWPARSGGRRRAAGRCPGRAGSHRRRLCRLWAAQRDRARAVCRAVFRPRCSNRSPISCLADGMVFPTCRRPVAGGGCRAGQHGTCLPDRLSPIGHDPSRRDSVRQSRRRGDPGTGRAYGCGARPDGQAGRPGTAGSAARRRARALPAELPRKPRRGRRQRQRACFAGQAALQHYQAARHRQAVSTRAHCFLHPRSARCGAFLLPPQVPH